jgi:hypothetical protein
MVPQSRERQIEGFVAHETGNPNTIVKSAMTMLPRFGGRDEGNICRGSRRHRIGLADATTLEQQRASGTAAAYRSQTPRLDRLIAPEPFQRSALCAILAGILPVGKIRSP